MVVKRTERNLGTLQEILRDMQLHPLKMRK